MPHISKCISVRAVEYFSTVVHLLFLPEIDVLYDEIHVSF